MSKIIAGIVLYNPDLTRLSENIDSIINQVQAVVMFDNGSNNIEDIIKLVKKYPKLVLLKSDTNVGIAAALNRIFEFSINEYSPSYILTLDQDSISPPNIISSYKKYLNKNVGILTPKIKDINAGDLDKPNGNVEEIEECITSAALTNCEAWKSVNGFDESMFIDNVDFDFCNRIRKKGYRILRINAVTLTHEIGHIKVYRTPFGKIFVKNHSSFRKYYIARNTIYMARKNGKSLDVFLSYLRVVKQMLLVLFFEKSKVDKELSLIKGAYEGATAQVPLMWR